MHIESEQRIIEDRTPANDRQVAGQHYKNITIQPWMAMESWMSKEQFEGFLLGNAIKYLARAGKKGDFSEDIAKAQHYIEKLLEITAEPKSTPTPTSEPAAKPYIPLP